MGYRKNYRSGSHTSPGIGWSLGLIICLVAVVLALPALAAGMVLQRLTLGATMEFSPLVRPHIGRGRSYFLSLNTWAG